MKPELLTQAAGRQLTSCPRGSLVAALVAGVVACLGLAVYVVAPHGPAKPDHNAGSQSSVPSIEAVPVPAISAALQRIMTGTTGLTLSASSSRLVAQSNFVDVPSVAAGRPVTLDLTVAASDHELLRLWASNEKVEAEDANCDSRMKSDYFLSCDVVKSEGSTFLITTLMTDSEEFPEEAGGPPSGFVRYVRSVSLVGSRLGRLAIHDNVDVESGVGGQVSDDKFLTSTTESIQILSEAGALLSPIMAQ